MTDDFEREMEKASLLKNKFYLILHHSDNDSFNMTAYDTTDGDDINLDDVPAGMVILNGMIELLENDFDKVWDAGMMRLSFISTMQALKLESNDDNIVDVADRIAEKNSNIIKVNFGKEQ